MIQKYGQQKVRLDVLNHEKNSFLQQVDFILQYLFFLCLFFLRLIHASRPLFCFALSRFACAVFNDNYGARSRCMSLAPNALNLKIAKGATKPCHKALIGRVGHLTAYDTDYFDKQCLERLQTFDYWEGEQFNDFANVVTRNCDGVFYNNRGGDRPWLKYQTAFSGEFSLIMYLSMSVYSSSDFFRFLLLFTFILTFL